ncbi:hypothetical protein QFZ52_000495 [Arthrobacter woluwensis]|nr:hypothetical protein [Arthrobacter woluwensis]
MAPTDQPVRPEATSVDVQGLGMRRKYFEFFLAALTLRATGNFIR